MCKFTDKKPVKQILNEDQEIEIEAIGDYEINEYLSHSENLNQQDSNIDGHAYHSNGESLVIYNSDDTSN